MQFERLAVLQIVERRPGSPDGWTEVVKLVVEAGVNDVKLVRVRSDDWSILLV